MLTVFQFELARPPLCRALTCTVPDQTCTGRLMLETATVVKAEDGRGFPRAASKGADFSQGIPPVVTGLT